MLEEMEDIKHSMASMCHWMRDIAADVRKSRQEAVVIKDNVDMITKEVLYMRGVTDQLGKDVSSMKGGMDHTQFQIMVAKVESIVGGNRNVPNKVPDTWDPEHEGTITQVDKDTKDAWIKDNNKCNWTGAPAVDVAAYRQVKPKAMDENYVMEERIKQLQSKAYRIIRENMEVDKDSNGWMDVGRLAQKLREPGIYGSLEDKDLWEIIMCTKDYNNKDHSSYQLFWYADDRAGIKIRFKPKWQDFGAQQKKRAWGQPYHQ